MLKTLSEVTRLIEAGKLLHIAGNEELLKQLPKGNWIGGSIEYFMTETGGVVSDEALFVRELDFDTYCFATYDEKNIAQITQDAYPNGFSLIILPFDSEVHKTYAKSAADFEDIFLKNVIGWVSGVNLSVPGQTPIAYDGSAGQWFADKAVVLHVSLPEDYLVNIGIINIFSEDPSSPVFEFLSDSFSTETCLIDGQETNLAQYIAEQELNTQLPLIGDYAGMGINISWKSIEEGVVNFYAPVFQGIKYRLAQGIPDYAQAFREHLEQFKGIEAVFSCNCVLNFLYGELEGKKVESFLGPITFGEVAFQLVNQTLVYMVVTKM